MEAERQADEDMERMQKDVRLFNVMKYKKGFCDGAQDKLTSYPLGDKEA